MLGAIIVYIVVGLIIGAIARLVLPGRDPMGILPTMLLGIAGAVIGGIIGRAIFDPKDNGVHWILSVIVAVVLLLIVRQVGGRRRVL